MKNTIMAWRAPIVGRIENLPLATGHVITETWHAPLSVKGYRFDYFDIRRQISQIFLL